MAEQGQLDKWKEELAELKKARDAATDRLMAKIYEIPTQYRRNLTEGIFDLNVKGGFDDNTNQKR